MKNIIFLTKDAMLRSYLPTYGNEYWKTPNIDALASKGTIFNNHHTGAPSTIMSNMCMFTKKFCHDSELSDYTFSGIHYGGETLWTEAEKRGYSCHIIWEEAWKTVFHAEDRYYCYGENTVIHYLEGLRQGVGAHYIHKEPLKVNEEKTQEVFQKIRTEIEQILNNSTEPVFLWVHIPHVINGRTGYGTDIDAFDDLVGLIREYFDDDQIFISADHGNMNCVKGKVGYGHDVYEPAALIPLITPRIDGMEICNSLTSNVDITEVIFDRKIHEREFIYCDSTFYGQANRKLAIYKGKFKYIYNKINGTEELYDLEFDPQENANLANEIILDVDRNVKTPLRELYFYPDWDCIPLLLQELRAEKDRIWRTESFRKEFISKTKYRVHAAGYDQLMHFLLNFKHN